MTSEVTQADRDLVHKIHVQVNGNYGDPAQDVARHRIEATRQLEADKVELVDALRDLLTHSCVSESVPEDKLPEDHAAESNARALIRKHGGNHD